ncbi:MAG: putative trifunctional 2-polyprenylphenol hydroxylase/glutamate synthase subunit beta/ferritin domain-containing protein [Syntrophaceae bacterium PtaB.Bin038]|nr:MAG: putative trifunctional 2-polyprenylphenol hydroxylase/glutamate synthase subunit beta/ferritin domain-containing protein [Syntrophaceae bacterium PtaB.Bin038]
MARTEMSIFDFAVRAERDGIGFYTRAAKKFRETDLRDLFMKLAKEEAKHLETFVGIKAKAEKKGADPVFRSEQVSDYLDTIIREGLFPKGDSMVKRLEKVNDVGSACAIAMEAEKNAILLYSELARLAKGREQRKIFEDIAKEERSHIVMVGTVRADYDPAYAAMRFGRFF